MLKGSIKLDPFFMKQFLKGEKLPDYLEKQLNVNNKRETWF